MVMNRTHEPVTDSRHVQLRRLYNAVSVSNALTALKELHSFGKITDATYIEEIQSVMLNDGWEIKNLQETKKEVTQ